MNIVHSINGNQLANKFSLCLYFPHDFAFKQFQIPSSRIVAQDKCVYMSLCLLFLACFFRSCTSHTQPYKVINQIAKITRCVNVCSNVIALKIDDAFKLKSIHCSLSLCLVAAHTICISCGWAWTFAPFATSSYNIDAVQWHWIEIRKLSHLVMWMWTNKKNRNLSFDSVSILVLKC